MLMLVEIKNDIFQNEEIGNISHLLGICFYNDRYDVLVDYPTLEELGILNMFNKSSQDALLFHFNKAVTQGKKAHSFVSLKDVDDNIFKLNEAIRYLNQPIRIILENNLNDSFFIKAIIKHFDLDGNVKKHLEQDWLQFDNAGGCTNVENVIKSRINAFDSLSKEAHKYLRCLVILDSDKEYPSAPVKDSYIKLILFLELKNVPYVVLEKRCMENYMPDEVYDQIQQSNHQAWINVYKHLSEEQKDYLNINKGFTNKEKPTRSDLDTEVLNLYSNVSDFNFNILDKGLKLSDFKTTFPQKFNTHPVHKTTLLQRTKDQSKSNELQLILDEISKLL